MPASSARFLSSGPASASASTFTITMCLRCSQQASTCAMPMAGLPVASMMMSMCGDLISAMPSSMMAVLPCFAADSSEVAVKLSSFQPTLRKAALARSGERSAMPTMCMPGVRGTCERYIEPNLPAPIMPTRTGLPSAARCCSFAKRFIDIPGLRRPCRQAYRAAR